MNPTHAFINCKFVVADSSPSLRLALCSTLTHDLGVQDTIEIEAPEDLLTLLPKQKLDFVILDIEFAQYEQINVITEIQHAQPDAKIVVLTTSEDKFLAQEMSARGIHAYCLKGLSLALFVEIIHRVQQGQYWYDPRIISAGTERSSTESSSKVKTLKAEAKRPLLKFYFKELTHHLLRTV